MAQALGQMYRAEPRHPVAWLSAWLSSYSEQQAFADAQDLHAEQTAARAVQLANDRHDAALRAEAAALGREQERQRRAAVRGQVEAADDHERLLAAFLPAEVFRAADLTGVYVGHYAPAKAADPADDDPAPAYALQYVGGDDESLVV